MPHFDFTFLIRSRNTYLFAKYPFVYFDIKQHYEPIYPINWLQILLFIYFYSTACNHSIRGLPLLLLTDIPPVNTRFVISSFSILATCFCHLFLWVFISYGWIFLYHHQLFICFSFPETLFEIITCIKSIYKYSYYVTTSKSYFESSPLSLIFPFCWPFIFFFIYSHYFYFTINPLPIVDFSNFPNTFVKFSSIVAITTLCWLHMPSCSFFTLFFIFSYIQYYIE